MASEIKAGNATDGLSVSSDNTGTLNIKTGTGAGTTAISIDASQNVAIPGTLTVGGIPAGGNYVLQAYTSPTTWNATAAKAAGLKAIKVTVVGAGGAGGNASATPGPSSGSGGGGGGGGSAVEYVPASSITPGNKTVTAGPGTNSFGPWGTATPNSPTATTSATAGAAGAANTPTAAGANGAGGVGSGGSLNIGGGSGITAGTPNSGAFGGASILGGSVTGQMTVTTVTGLPGLTGLNYGGGGSGATKNQITTGYSGGAGAPGVVIIEEFY